MNARVRDCAHDFSGLLLRVSSFRCKTTSSLIASRFHTGSEITECQIVRTLSRVELSCSRKKEALPIVRDCNCYSTQLSLSLFLCVSLYLPCPSLPVSPYIPLSLSTIHSWSPCLFFSVSVSQSFSLSIPLSLCIFICLCVSVSLPHLSPHTHTYTQRNTHIQLLHKYAETRPLETCSCVDTYKTNADSFSTNVSTKWNRRGNNTPPFAPTQRCLSSYPHAYLQNINNWKKENKKEIWNKLNWKSYQSCKSWRIRWLTDANGKERGIVGKE